MYKFRDMKLYLLAMHGLSTITVVIQCQFLIYGHCDFVTKNKTNIVGGHWPHRNASIFQICLMVLLQYVLSDLTRFVDPENISVDTRIRILCQLELAILARFLKNNCAFMQFFDPENIGVDTKIKILCQLELEILSKFDFHGGHFEKCPKPILRTNLFSGNIANAISWSLLNKMVPPMESSGGGAR